MKTQSKPSPKRSAVTPAIWPLWTTSLSHLFRPAPAEEFAQFAKWMQEGEVTRQIWSGDMSDGLTPAAHRDWAQKLINKLGRNAAHCSRLRRWWDEIISFGNGLGKWNIDPLPVYVRLTPPKPGLALGDMTILSQYRQCEDLFWSSLVLRDVSAAQVPFCVVASAIISDGITDPAVLVALAALSADCVEVINGEMFLYLSVRRGVNAVASETLAVNALTAVWVTRWLNGLPSATHHLLQDDADSLGVWQAQTTAGKSVTTVALGVVGATWNALGLGELSPKSSLRGAFIAHVLRSAPYAVNHRAGLLPSNALPLAVFHRLNAVEPAHLMASHAMQTRPAMHPNRLHAAMSNALTLTTSAEHKPSDGAVDSDIEAVAPLDDVDGQDAADIAESHDALDWEALEGQFDPRSKALNQHTYICSIGNMFKSKKKPVAAVYADVNLHCSSLWPTTLQLARFACWRRGMELVDGVKETAGKAVDEGSIYQYLGTISKYLTPIVGTINLLEEDADDIEAIFEEAAQSIKSNKRRSYFWGRLRDFYRFLTLFGAPAIAFTELDGYVCETEGSTQFTVISEQDFQHFKNEALKACANQMHTPAMRSLLAAILGYRCGLRRREVQMLLVKNIHPGKEPIICIRANRFASLKSRRASRRLPLFALLPSDELKLLMNYWESRLEVAGTRNALMFCHLETPQIPLASGVLFNAITQSFQAMMGDEGPRFRFHHLRHSFANRVFLLLIVADRPQLIRTRLGWMERLGISEETAVKLRNQLFVSLAHSERHPSGKLAYLMCELLGHLSPQTTFQHYLHVIFWLAKQESEVHLHERLKQLSLDDLARVCAMPLTVIHTAAYHQWKGEPLQMLRARMVNTIAKCYVAKPVAPVTYTHDLQPILTAKAEEPLFGPSQFMVMAATAVHTHDKYLRTSNTEWLERAMSRNERNFSVQRAVLERVCVRYRRLYARRVDKKHATNGFKLPPRAHNHRREFWQVMSATHAAFVNKGARESLILAAEALVYRKGTETVNLGFQKDYQLIPAIAKGLLAMGISPSVMRLEIVVKGVAALSSSVQTTAERLREMGVQVDQVQTDSRQKIAPEGHLHLHVGQFTTGSDQPAPAGAPVLKSSAGVCQGLNYAALWVLAAADHIELSQKSITGLPAVTMN